MTTNDQVHDEMAITKCVTEKYLSIRKDDFEELRGKAESLQKECDQLSESLTEYVDKCAALKRENESLRKQISTKVEAIKEEHTETVSRPTILASLLAGLGFKGTLVREQPFFNSNVSDKPVGSFQEILKID